MLRGRYFAARGLLEGGRERGERGGAAGFRPHERRRKRRRCQGAGFTEPTGGWRAAGNSGSGRWGRPHPDDDEGRSERRKWQAAVGMRPHKPYVHRSRVRGGLEGGREQRELGAGRAACSQAPGGAQGAGGVAGSSGSRAGAAGCGRAPGGTAAVWAMGSAAYGPAQALGCWRAAGSGTSRGRERRDAAKHQAVQRPYGRRIALPKDPLKPWGAGGRREAVRAGGGSGGMQLSTRVTVYGLCVPGVLEGGGKRRKEAGTATIQRNAKAAN
ncbi:hypothetical protein B0H16DRAFT_1484220 [Mycena metata]|uniref:Uncharacterized protein n=1 Tax=Mycena metata TaxID=1033252 RepID=A0AAD7DU45_9AGAR|nr:hypothetical protein B0H16DRAFT_1484220 [Mycena metata]